MALILEEIYLHSIHARETNTKEGKLFSMSELSSILSSDSKSMFTKYREQITRPVFSQVENNEIISYIKEFKNLVYQSIVDSNSYVFANDLQIFVRYDTVMNFLHTLNSKASSKEVLLSFLFRLGEFSNQTIFKKELSFILEHQYKENTRNVIMFTELYPKTDKVNLFLVKDISNTYTYEKLILLSGMYLRQHHYDTLFERLSSVIEAFRNEISK